MCIRGHNEFVSQVLSASYFFVIQSIWQQDSKYGRKNVCKCYFGDTMYPVSAGVYKHFEDL
jgi:hypothetical protein